MLSKDLLTELGKLREPDWRQACAELTAEESSQISGTGTWEWLSLSPPLHI